MKKLFITALIIPNFLLAQSYTSFLKQVSDSILMEGIEMYECAVASKISSEFVIDKLSVEGISGYITYRNEKSVKTIFLSGDEKKPVVRYAFSYPIPFDEENKNIDGEPRPVTDYEFLLAKMKSKIQKEAKKKKSFFTNYENIVLNPVFFLRGNFTYVYLISSSGDESFVPFGNDYLFIFNEKAKLVSNEKIHQNLIEVPISNPDTLATDEALSSYHTHSEFSPQVITSTDICNVLLHQKKVKWDSHIVVSENYVSFFFPGQKQLEIITKEDYEKLKKEE